MRHPPEHVADVVCVGGPLHGQRRPFKHPAQVLKTILPSSHSNVREAWGFDKDVGDAELSRILLSEYRPDTVCVVSCGMEFRADVWRWVHTPRRDTPHIALGILLATLISDGLDNPKGRNPCT